MSQLNPYQRFLASRKAKVNIKAVIESRKPAVVTKQPSITEIEPEEKTEENIFETQIEQKEPAEAEIEKTEETAQNDPAEAEFAPKKKKRR